MLACLAAVASMMTACSGNDDDLGKIEVPGTDYTLPQGKNAEADQTIVSLFDKYGSYFLYDFNDKDFQWTLVNTSTVGDDTYRFDPINPDSVPNLLNAIQQGWLSFYDDSFLKKALPYRVFLAQNVQIRVRVFDWDTWDYILSWSNRPSRHLASQIAIGNIDDPWEKLSASQKRAFKSYVQSDFLMYCVEQGSVTIPDEFYAASDYTQSFGWDATTEDARNAGFVYNPMTEEEWATENGPSRTGDINSFIASLVYRTDAEWQSDLQYSLIKRKYDILVAAFNAAGIDIRKIGNATFE